MALPSLKIVKVQTDFGWLDGTDSFVAHSVVLLNGGKLISVPS